MKLVRIPVKCESVSSTTTTQIAVCTNKVWLIENDYNYQPTQCNIKEKLIWYRFCIYIC